MLGFKGLEDFMVNFWEKWACSKGRLDLQIRTSSVEIDLCFQEPENLLVLLQTWQNGDVSQQEPYNGDFEKAMASIKAKALVLPAKTDLYFP